MKTFKQFLGEAVSHSVVVPKDMKSELESELKSMRIRFTSGTNHEGASIKIDINDAVDVYRLLNSWGFEWENVSYSAEDLENENPSVYAKVKKIFN